MAELGQPKIPATLVFAPTPRAGEVRPMTAGAVIGRAGAEIGCEFIRRRQRPPDEAKGEINRKIGEVRLSEFRDQRTGQNQTRHARYRHTQKQYGRQRRRQLNVLSARLCRNFGHATQVRKPHSSAAAGSSPSASRSGPPPSTSPPFSPTFWRIAASIFAGMSALALRKALEFSRPSPRRWLA